MTSRSNPLPLPSAEELTAMADQMERERIRMANALLEDAEAWLVSRSADGWVKARGETT